MKTPWKAWIRAGFLMAGLLTPTLCYARVGAPDYEIRRSAVESREPLLLENYLPWYALPDRFLFTGNYFTQLSVTSLRIDHIAENSRCTKRNRTFMIALGYQQPIGNRLFSTGFELPLLSADRFSVTRLRPASVGDYVLHFSNTALLEPMPQVLISSRF